MGNKSRPSEMGDFESILEKNTDIKYSEKWHPTLVSTFENELSNGQLQNMNIALRKNIAYALQYLQFLQLEQEEVHLHEIVATHLLKSYIITAMGIVEGIFYHIVTTKGFQKKTDWELLGKPIHTNVFREENREKKYVITVEQKLLTPSPVQMDFEYLLNKVQEKRLIGLTGKAYPFLKKLKRLRNKVHLHIAVNKEETDYNSIGYYDYLLARYILLKILTDAQFDPKPNSALYFLKLSDTQNNMLANYLMEMKNKNGQTENAHAE